MPLSAGRRHTCGGFAVGHSHVLAFLQQVGTEHDDAIARRDATGDRSGFLTEAGHLDQAPVGIFRRVERPSYDDLTREQISLAQQGSNGTNKSNANTAQGARRSQTGTSQTTG